MSIWCSLISRYGPFVSLVLIWFYQGEEEKRKMKKEQASETVRGFEGFRLMLLNLSARCLAGDFVTFLACRASS